MSLPAPLSPPPIIDNLSWLTGGGEMGALIRSMDWTNTPLGPLQDWPQSLRTSVSLCLSSTFPILVAWGPDDIQIYNDAYRPICGELHPRAMGGPFKEIWASALPVVGDAFDRAHQGEGVYIRDQRMFLDRYGYLEEAFMTFSFSPIRDESGEVGGIFHPISESTATVLNARRTRALRDLTAALADARDIGDVGRDIEAVHASMVLDLPFVLLYQFDAASGALHLRASAGLEAHPGLAPEIASLDDACWPFARTFHARTAQRVDGLAAAFGAAPCGPYDNPPDTALVLPVTVPGQQELYGFVVAGASAARALDVDYGNFYDLLGAAVNTAAGNVVAYEKEQRRAEELAQIDRAKTAFFSNVSHEFRTPLTLILGPLGDALADQAEPLGPAQRHRLTVTHQNSLRLLKLVNTLLDFSRIEAGRVRAAYVPVDLARLTFDLAGVFESAMEKGGLAYRVDVRDLGRPVEVDRDMWEKIVFNLLSNAFKFTLSGSVQVTLAPLAPLAPDCNFVRLSVADTGCGIPAGELPRVFERFHRIEGTPGRTYEGTGIGLALIQELVHLHGGTIAVSSVVGAGTRFDVTIPFAHGGQAAGADPAPVVTSETNASGAAYVQEALGWLPDQPAMVVEARTPALAGAGPLPRILIADDNNDMRAYLASLLAPHAEVTVCSDGEAAFALLQNDPPDLLVSDVMMPKLDGFGLIARIRADAALRQLPVILLSARAGAEAKVEGLQAGADDYLVKPFAANELLARVGRQVAIGRERRQQQAALEEREAYFRALVDTAPVMLWTTDAAGHVTYLSERWHAYTGHPAGPELAAMLVDSIHADDVVRVRTAFADAIAARASYSSDYRLRGSDGAYRWHLDCGAPRFDRDGAFEGHVGTLVDVHARTMLQQRLEDVAFAGNIGVWYSDAPFTTYQLNPQMASHLDLPGLADVPLRDVLAALAQDDQARLGAAIATALRDGAPLDIALTNAAGTRSLRAIGWCDLNDQGEPVRFDGVTLDISSHKQAEHDLRVLADALADKNRMQSEFLFTLAHELRNPLAPIRTGLELMRIAPNAATATRVQAIMRRQVDHMAHLVDDLLDMARLSEGKVALRREPVALDALVNEAVDISMPLVDAGRHTLSRHLPAAPVTLQIDRHRMVQVLSNLLNNAAKYSPPDSAIDIAAHIDGASIVLAVTDNGIGIDASVLPLVFDMYAQAQQSTGTAQGGLGVGLNLVRRLVELHGGSVQADSAGLGHGSRFTVTLPLGAASVPAPVSVSVSAPAATPDAAGTLRILVVDDNVDASNMLGALLELRGHAVQVVHDGAAALAAVAGFAPDVVFLDIGLPDQSGYDVAVALRQRPGMAAVTLVALTGWGAEQDRQQAHAAGFDAHLTKPADLASVERLLQEAAEKIANR